MSARKFFKLVRPDERRRLRRWLVWCMLLAAAINVPFAVSRVELVNAASPRGSSFKSVEEMPEHWPIATPHAEPWPAPTYWNEWTGFGKWFFDVRSSNPDPNKSGFTLTLRRSGWPLPVLEQRMMWWNWDNPALKGPKSDPPMLLMPAGLILNPIIVGGGSWVLMVAAFFVLVIRRRDRRMRRGLCLDCGYDLRGLQVGSESQPTICPECGSSREEMERPLA